MIFTFKLRFVFNIFCQEISWNGYPCNFIDVFIKTFLNNIFIDKNVYALATKKKELICVLSFIGKKSIQLRSKLVKSIQNNLSFCHLKVAFQSPNKLRTLFRCKDTLDEKMCSDLVYRYSCSSCNATYYVKTYRHVLTRVTEHIGI